jgi:hypothetical protein
VMVDPFWWGWIQTIVACFPTVVGMFQSSLPRPILVGVFLLTPNYKPVVLN